MSAPPSPERLAAFERAVERALADGREHELEVLGYGEVTTVLALDPDWAVKRLPAFPDEAAARACADVIRAYVAELEARGVVVAETHVDCVDAPCGSWSVYCVQPRLPSQVLGPNFVRELGREAAVAAIERVLEIIASAVCERVAPDGQLSNWAFVDGRILYLDVSSPFLRNEQGRDLLDWSQYLRSLPAPLRAPARRWVLPHILDKYFTLRGQVIDLLGNLIKERLEGLIEAVRVLANERLRLSPPVTTEDVRAYYRSDARTYAFLQAVRRADRFVQRRLLRRPYPYILPPPIDRNL